MNETNPQDLVPPSADPEDQVTFARMDSLVVRAQASINSISVPQWAANIRVFLQETHGRVVSAGDLAPPHFNGKNIMICASGPSLEGCGCVERLKGFGGTIVAGATATPFLLSQGITPSVIVISDSNPILHQMLWPYGTELAHTPIILPVFAHSLWRKLPIGAAYFYYKPYVQQTDGVLGENALNAFIDGMFPDVGTWILQSGCVTNTMILIAHMWAQQWPIQRAILLGADFGFTSPAFKRVPMAFGGATFAPSVLDSGRTYYPGPNGVTMSVVDTYYAINTLLVAANVTIDVILGSGPSALDHYLPYWSWERILESDGSLFSSKEKRFETLRKLARSFTREVDPILKAHTEAQARERAALDTFANARPADA